MKAELSAAPLPAAKQGRLPKPSGALAAALSGAAEALSVLVSSSAARATLVAKQAPSAEVTYFAIREAPQVRTFGSAFLSMAADIIPRESL